MRENALMHGPQMERSASDPVGERRAIEANALALGSPSGRARSNSGRLRVKDFESLRASDRIMPLF
jgi:hypothetical protein